MEVVLRAGATFGFLFLVLKGVGKRELAQLTAFELVLLVTIGDLVQQGVTQDDTSLAASFLAVGTLALLVTAFAWISQRSRRLRRVLDGVPVAVVRDGAPVGEALRRERVPLDDLAQAARAHGIVDLSEVCAAYLEPDGRISFLTEEGPRGDDDDPTSASP